MQPPTRRLSNDERRQATRTALISAARRLFVDKGYAETGTPEIVSAAGVTRGALYHHFADKADLFLAVATEAAREIAAAISEYSANPASPLDALIDGARAYFKAMAEDGRSRVLLLEAPSVLAPDQLSALSDLAGSGELREGLAALLQSGASQSAPVIELTAIMSAAFDRAALEIANGAPEANYKLAIELLLGGLAQSARCHN